MTLESLGPARRALQVSLTGLSAVRMEDRPLSVTLAEVAAFAEAAVMGADGVSLALQEVAGADVVVASTEQVEAVDVLQQSLGEGPVVDAFRVGRSVVSGSLGGDGRWPRFGPRAGRMGMHSALALPLVVADEVVGVLSVYGHRRDAFPAEAVAMAQWFSAPAAVTVANARGMERGRLLAQQLEQALSSRPVIDQAIGILMSRGGIDAEEAFDRLRAVSQAEGTKLADVAARTVAQAVNRARTRRDIT